MPIFTPLANRDFTHVDENPVSEGGLWVRDIHSAGSNLQILGNKLTPTLTGNDSGAHYTGVAFTDNQYASALMTTVGVTGDGSGPGLSLLCLDGVATQYRFSVNHAVSGFNAEFCRFIGGGFTSIITFNIPFTDGDRFYFAHQDGVLYLFDVNKVQIVAASVPGTRLSGGTPGLTYSSNASTTSLDDAEFGTFVADVYAEPSRPARGGRSPFRRPFTRRLIRPASPAESVADLNLPPVINEYDAMNRSRFGWSPSRRPQMRRRLRASRAGEMISVAGNLFFQSVDGTLTSSGALVNQTGKITAGSLTSSGALLKQVNKILAGTLTDSGALVKQTSKILAGTLTDSGVLAAAKVTLKTIQGTLTSSGALLKQTNKILAGTLTSSGALLKQMNKILAGTLTSSGVLTTIKVVLKTIQGTLTSSGALLKRDNKVLAGSLTSSGTLTKLTAKTFAGTLTSSGVLAAVRTVLKTIQGTLTSSGALIRRCGKGLTGTLTTAGLLGKQFKQTIAGTLTSAGALIGTKSGFVLQALSLVATRGRVFVVKSRERTFSIATRVRMFVRRSRSREE